MRLTRPLAMALALGMLTLPGRGGAAPPSSCGAAPADEASLGVFTGSFGAEHRGAYVLVPFEVPAGMTRVRVRLCYDQIDLPVPGEAGLRHTLDLGIYEPKIDDFWDGDEFRGWGGSSRLNALITPEGTDAVDPTKTTVGFKPGLIPPGTWAAEIGIAAVAEVGDLDGRVGWRVETFAANNPADTDEPWTPSPYDETPRNPNPGWYAGDMHVHAKHSNPNDALMDTAFGYAFGSRPTGAGLDFVTLSDYVTDRHWDEIGRYQSTWPNKLIIRSAEVITYRGHLNNHASATWVDYRTGPIYRLDAGNTLTLLRPATPPSTIFDAVQAPHGWTQVNHPTIFPSKVPPFALQCRGCSWEYSDIETDWSKVDAFEVTTGPAGYTDPKGNEPGPNPFTPLSIEWWDRLRRDGHDITGVGASDSHRASAESLTSAPIGEATTVVYAPELSEAGIRAGILAGHAYVKFFSSDGPDLRFEARGPAGPAVMMGDALHAGTATFTARVINGMPSATSPQPRVLLVLRDGFPILAAPVLDNDFELPFTAAVPGDYRLQLMRGTAFEALTNPITLCPVPLRDNDDRCF